MAPRAGIYRVADYIKDVGERVYVHIYEECKMVEEVEEKSVKNSYCCVLFELLTFFYLPRTLFYEFVRNIMNVRSIVVGGG